MTDQNRIDKLEERIARLEDKISNLESYLQEEKTETNTSRSSRLVIDSSEDQIQIPADHTEEPKREEGKEEALTDGLSLGENWLNRVGIGLLLLGTVFLFKYSIDQGWLIPPVRSAIGLLIGLVLLVFGLQMKQERGTIKHLLLGGGIAAFYITGFATFQLYDFAPYVIVWIFMVVVTLLALSLSLQQDEPILSILGIIGGLGTPFMLYRGEGALLSLIIYSSMILTGAGVIYRYKGWKSLLWSTFTAGSLLYLVILVNNIYTASSVPLADRWILQAGILFFMAVIWVIPLFREVGMSRNSFAAAEFNENYQHYTARPSVQIISVIVPVLTFFYSREIWYFNLDMWGGVALISSLVIGYLYMPLRSEGLNRLSVMHAYSAMLLLTVALVLLLDGNILFLGLVLEALALRIIASKTIDQRLSIASHIVFSTVGLWLLNRLSEMNTSSPVLLNLDSITNLAVIGIFGLAVPRYLFSVNVKLIYQLVAHFGLLGLFLSELSGLQDGHAWVTTAWGIYAILLVIIGFWIDRNSVRLIGMGTVFLVAGKLLLIDLSQIQAILRILLFIGFGALFLALGYYLQTRMGSSHHEAVNTDSDNEDFYDY